MKKRLTLLTNSIPAYREELFEVLSQTFKLEIFLSQHGTKDRNWDNESISNADIRILRLFRLPIGGLNIFIPKLIPNLHLSNCIIISDSMQMILTSLLLVNSKYIKGKPIVLWSSYFSNNFHRESSNILKKLFVRIYEKAIIYLAKRADGILCYNESSKSFLVNNNIDVNKIFVGTQTMHKNIPSGGDPIKFRTLMKIDRDDVLIVICSYLTFRKGLDRCIDVITELRKTRLSGYQVIIAGTGPYENEISQLADEIDNVHFLGYVDGEDRANLFASGDIFLDLTRFDPGGWTVFEAGVNLMSVITTENNANGLSHIKHGVNGYLVDDVYNSRNIALMIMDLIDNSDKRNLFGDSLNDEIKRLPVELAVKNFNTAINFAINQKS
tara:strand:+ start:5477 stop:6625 length:1149 start_codon:yes stop_codon:yes gene_type:complete